MGAEPQAREHHCRGEGNRLLPGERPAEPVPGGGVLTRALVDGVQQHVGIDEQHASRAARQPGGELLILELAGETERLGDVDERLPHVVGRERDLRAVRPGHAARIASFTASPGTDALVDPADTAGADPHGCR
jgi:hypothetical protein